MGQISNSTPKLALKSRLCVSAFATQNPNHFLNCNSYMVILPRNSGLSWKLSWSLLLQTLVQLIDKTMLSGLFSGWGGAVQDHYADPWDSKSFSNNFPMHSKELVSSISYQAAAWRSTRHRGHTAGDQGYELQQDLYGIICCSYKF